MAKTSENLGHHKNGLFYVIRKDFFSIPVSIRIISLSLFIFILWWGLGADTFFSLYVKFIVDNVFWVSVIGALLALSKLFFTLPIGMVDDHSDTKSIVFLSKIAYVFAWFLYFFAGMFHSVIILINAVALNGFASAALLTTYQTFIREHSQKNNRCTVFGLYFSSINLAYVIWAIISSILIDHVYLPYLYLFIVLFALVSLLTDNMLPNLEKEQIKKLFGKETFLHQFFREVFSFSLIKKTILDMKSYSHKLFGALEFEFLFNVLNYISFLFIPIVAVANNLSLSQIAILFAVMRVPYIINFFTAELADKYDKKTFILTIMIFLAFLFALLGYNESFGSVVTISFGISIGLSMMRPVISWLISDYTHPQHGGTITGAGEFIGRAWDIVGSLVVGILSVAFGLNFSFVLVGILLFGFSIYQIIKRMLPND